MVVLSCMCNLNSLTGEPKPLAPEAQSLNLWTSREVSSVVHSLLYSWKRSPRLHRYEGQNLRWVSLSSELLLLIATLTCSLNSQWTLRAQGN